jgi:hypothetical protein
VRLPARISASVLVVGVVYLVTLFAIEREGFWITDNANKFLQLQAIVDSGYTDYSIPWLGMGLDPEMKLNPLPAPFSVVRDGKIYSQYAPLFAVASSLPYRWFGYTGLYLLPLLGALLTLAGVARLAESVGLEARWRHMAVLLAGVCTPLWFYAVVYWEHALAACLAVWAVDLHLRWAEHHWHGRLVAGAMAAAGMVWFRDEALLLCLVLLLFVFVQARGHRLSALGVSGVTMLVGIAPLLVFQWFALGDPLGFHVRANLTDIGGHLASRGEVFYRLFVATDGRTPVSILIALPFLAALFVYPRLSPRWFERMLVVCAVIASAAGAFYIGGMIVTESPIPRLLGTNSLFPVATFLLLGLLRCSGSSGDAAARRLWALALAYGLAYALAAPLISSGGIHWGNRFLLPLYPLLTVLVVRNLAACSSTSLRSVRWVAVAVTFAIALAAQIYSVDLLATKKDFSARANRALAGRSETAMVANTWWIPQELHWSIREKPVFFVRNTVDLINLRNRLRSTGFERFLLLTRESERPAHVEAQVIDDGGLNFFSIAFVEMTTE